MGLTPPPKVEKLQAALHTKAKGSPSYRFYALYDKLNKRHPATRLQLLPGQPGSSGRRRGDFRVDQGIRRGEVAGRIGGRTTPANVPSPACPKGEHPQGRPTGQNTPARNPMYSRSRGANGCGHRLGADLRGGPGARAICVSSGTEPKDAVRHVESLLRAGFTEVIDADLSGYFDISPTPN